MFDYNYKFVLYSNYLHLLYNATVIEEFLKEFSPENSLIYIGSKEMPSKEIQENFFNNTKVEVEKWYNTKYLNKKLNNSFIEELKQIKNTTRSSLSLRSRNNYLTKQILKVSCFDDKVIIILFFKLIEQTNMQFRN